MPPETVKLLRDMLDAAGAIATYTQGRSEQQYTADRPLRDAVHWNFAVLGEALAQLHKMDPACAERISEWRRVIGFRNQLIHGYGVVQDAITWSVVTEKLPVLIRELEALLRD